MTRIAPLDAIGRLNFHYAKKQDGARPLQEVVYIFVVVARKVIGIGSCESARRGYPMKSTSSLVEFCGGDATFCHVTAYTYASAAVGQNMSVNNMVPVIRFILYSLYYVAFGGGYASAHRGQPRTQ